MKKLAIGKLDTQLLKQLVIDKIEHTNSDVIKGSDIGQDCAEINFGDYDCIMSTDPITASERDIGRLAVHISCNDIATSGVMPIGIMLALLLPEGSSEESLKIIMAQATKAANEVGVEIIGGHTEVTKVVAQPVIVSTAVGKRTAGKRKLQKELRPGDVVLLTKYAGLEGTGILCSEKYDELKTVLTEKELAFGSTLLDRVSVVQEGIICAEQDIYTMHDVTEGGVLGSVWEMCSVNKVGVELYEQQIPVYDVTKKVAEHFNLDWKRLISSGCMMIMTDKERAELIRQKMKGAGIACTPIGKIKPFESGVNIIRCNGDTEAIALPGRDEIYKVM